MKPVNPLNRWLYDNELTIAEGAENIGVAQGTIGKTSSDGEQPSTRSIMKKIEKGCRQGLRHTHNPEDIVYNFPTPHKRHFRTTMDLLVRGSGEGKEICRVFQRDAPSWHTNKNG